MAFTLNISPLFDVAGFYGAGFPTLAGSIFSPPPPSGVAATPLATATSSTLSLAFASAAVPPAGSSSMLVTDTATGGDFLRSGAVAALPASPASATAITSSASIGAAAIIGRAAALSVPPTAVPGGVQALSALLTGGTFIPVTVALGPAIAIPGAGAIALSVTGTVIARTFFFGMSTIAMTATTTVTAAPSGDSGTAGRVLTVTLSPIGLSGLGAPVGIALGPMIASLLSGPVESMINSLILSTAASTVAASGLSLTPTAVISARRVVITASGVALQLVLSDLFGGAVVAPPKTLAIAISPAPAANVAQTYTVTVTDAVTGAAVTGAAVTLANSTGAPVSHATNSSGQAVFPNVALKMKQISIVVIEIGDDGKPHKVREVDLIPPTLTVTAAGFNSVTLNLL